MSMIHDVNERLLNEYFNFQLNFDSYHRKVLFLCLFLLVIGVLRLLFWRLSPVIYESCLLLIFYGVGKVLVQYDLLNDKRSASDIIGVNTLYMLATVFFFVATMELKATFTSYWAMWVVFIFLAPVFVINMYVISWILFVTVEDNYNLTRQDILYLTLVLSPVHVAYLLDYMQSLQCRIQDAKDGLRAEAYSSMWVSFLGTALVEEVGIRRSEGTYTSFNVFIFLLCQASGVLLGYIWSRILRYSIKGAYEMISITTLTTMCAAFMIQTHSMLLGISSALAVGTFGIIINGVIYRCKKESLSFYSEFWKLVLFLANSLSLALVGTLLGFMKPYSDVGWIRVVVVAYLLFMACRFILLVLICPILNTLSGKSILWMGIAIQMIGVYKGGANHVLALRYAVLNPQKGHIILMLTTCYTLVSYFFNVLLFPGVISIMGLNKYSIERMANMNLALSQTNYCREKAIFALKMDKVVVDANWLVVEEVTQLMHPYKKALLRTSKSDGKEDIQIRSITCPECQMELLAPPTKREVEALKKEARERMIKSQQVSFHRQYEMGSLTSREYSFLDSLTEEAITLVKVKLNAESVKMRSSFNNFLVKLKQFLIWFSDITEEVYYTIPSSTLGEWCFQITTDRNMQIVLALLTLLDTVITGAQVTVYYWFCKMVDGEFHCSTANWYFGLITQYIHIAFYFVTLIEVIIPLIGLGFDQYFSRNVNKIEFGIGFILGSLEIFIFANYCLSTGEKHPYHVPAVMIIKFVMFLRLAKMYILFSAVVPKIISRIDTTLTIAMMRNYELGKAYLVALNRTAALLNRIVYNEAVYNELLAEIDADRLYISRELGLIQKENPSIATTVKTRHAIRYVVNAMSDCIKDMKEEGVVDFIEADAIQEVLNKNVENLRDLTFISAPPPKDILKNVPWLVDDEENLQYLLTNAVLTNYDYGDILLHAGDDPVGIHLLVSGLLKSHYIPSTTTLQLSSKFGVLPNYDFFHNVKFDQPQEAYVVSGSIIGEIGTVSGRRYDMTIKCETAVQVYYISWEALKKLIYENVDAAGLLSKMWKAISIKIAVNILQYNVVSFQGWAPEKLLLYLNRGFVPVMPDMVSLTITNRVELIILIEGKLMDSTNRKVYNAPCNIPKNIYKLLLPEHKTWNFQTICETRMLIIPSNITTEEELKGPDGIFSFKSSSPKTRIEDIPKKVGFTVNATEEPPDPS